MTFTEQNIYLSQTFLIKFVLKYLPWIVITAAVSFCVLYFGYVIRQTERTYDGINENRDIDLEYLTNGWWLAIVTITSVGYGDGKVNT
jgi:hypothetical protein